MTCVASFTDCPFFIAPTVFSNVYLAYDIGTDIMCDGKYSSTLSAYTYIRTVFYYRRLAQDITAYSNHIMLDKKYDSILRAYTYTHSFIIGDEPA